MATVLTTRNLALHTCALLPGGVQEWAEEHQSIVAAGDVQDHLRAAMALLLGQGWRYEDMILQLDSVMWELDHPAG